MRHHVIQSFRVEIAPDAHNQVFLIFDTTLAGKHVFTACGVGRIQDGQPLLSPVAESTFMALMDYANSEELGQVHFMEIASTEAAPARVRKALEVADEKDVVFFLCRDSQIYDAAFFAIGVEPRPNGSVH